MTLHSPDLPKQDALARVINLARSLGDGHGSLEDRVNTAVSMVVDASERRCPLAEQRKLLSDALAQLRAEAAATSDRPLPSFLRAPATESTAAPAPTSVPSPIPAKSGDRDMLELARDIVRTLSDGMDFSDLAHKPRDQQEALIRDAIASVSEQRKLHLNGSEVAELVRHALADMLGLGPLEALLSDDTITDIMVNGPHQTYIERSGKLELTNIRFRDNDHVFAVASRIVSAVGRRIDESQPMVDARLKDGSRVNVAVPPLALDGPTITIRKFPQSAMELNQLVDGGSLSAQMAAFLGLAAYLRINMLVSGGTGSGKTTLMNAMSHYIPKTERIVTIEDAAELRFQQPHVVRFETRPPNVEGKGEVTMRTLMRNALRMRPDRIIIGEVRGDEVLDLLQAMNTGHDGSMSTLHANSPREALTRVEGMAALAGIDPGTGVVRRQLVDAVQLVVQVRRMRDGRRRITSISEIAGMAGDTITLQDLFAFNTQDTSTRAEVKGKFAYTGYMPKLAQRAADYGASEELAAILRG